MLCCIDFRAIIVLWQSYNSTLESADFVAFLIGLCVCVCDSDRQFYLSFFTWQFHSVSVFRDLYATVCSAHASLIG